jgi:DNA topoisomerase VI subunit A
MTDLRLVSIPSNADRELYYREVNLFHNAGIVNRYTDSIARTFGVSRSMLNIVRHSRAHMTVTDNSELDCSCQRIGCGWLYLVQIP